MRIKVIQPARIDREKKLRVCAYVRVSTDYQEQENSYENQIRYYEDIIKQRTDWEYAGVYSDYAISGYKEQRPGFLKMMEDARAGKFDKILVKSVSRFARNTETILKYSRELKTLGISVFFELQNFDTLSSNGEVMLTILSAYAQAESESNSENVSMSIRRKFANGEPNFPVNKIYGFTLDEAGVVTIQEEEAAVVRLIFDLAEKGVWVARITDYLNNNHIPAIRKNRWDQSQVRRMLSQEAYMGDRILQKTYRDSRRKVQKNRGEIEQWYVKNAHPAIVTKEQWYRVQDILLERNQTYFNAPPITEEKNLSTHSKYPYSGKLFCPYCGGVLIHRWEGNKRYENWICGNHRKKGDCPGISIPNKMIEKWGEVKEPLTVWKYVDMYGMTQVTGILKAEYEASEDCPYEVKEPEKPKIRPKKPTYRRVERPKEGRTSGARYPLSGKLFCPYCGKVLTHRWSDGVEYWMCSTNRNLYRNKSLERCRGFYFPAEATIGWGKVREQLVILPYKNEYGHRLYTAIPKEEYELSEECPYRKED